MAFKAVLFDLDGTLHDRAESVRRYLAGHVARFGMPEGYAERWTILDNFGYTPKVQLFRQIVQELRLAHDPDALVQDWTMHGKLAPGLMPHAFEVLTELKTRGLRLGLVTNGSSEGQRATLDGLDLSRAFDALVVSEEVGCSKPEPRIYTLALEQLGAKAFETLFVGDSPINDVQGPQQAGMKAALLLGGHALPAHIRPDYTLDDLRDVLEIVRAARPRA